MVKSFMDLLILDRIKESPIGANDAFDYFNEKFDILVSSGSLYSTMYSLERQGLVSANEVKRKRVYSLTKDGKEKLDFLTDELNIIKSCLEKYSNQNIDKNTI